MTIQEYAQQHRMVMMEVVKIEMGRYGISLFAVDEDEMVAIANQTFGQKLSHAQVAEIAQGVTGRSATVVKNMYGENRVRIEDAA